MNSVWWIGLSIVVFGAVASGVLLFDRHGAAPGAVSPISDGTRVLPGVGRRVSSVMLLLILTVGVAGLLAATLGAVIFLGGLSLTS